MTLKISARLASTDQALASMALVAGNDSDYISRLLTRSVRRSENPPGKEKNTTSIPLIINPAYCSAYVVQMGLGQAAIFGIIDFSSTR